MAGTTTETRAGIVIADRYRIIDRLGRGGMATVFLAEDELLSRQVALKRLHTAASESSIERFRREALLGAGLNHPNIVAVYDIISGPDEVLIVMEYVPGRPLSALISKAPLGSQDAVRILGQVAAGLDHAHARDVVHRDVKPANILVRDDGGVKLSDLGVATAVHASRITATHDVVGTLTYMAPERLAGRAGGPPADVYSLAAVAFETLGGRTPDRGETPAEILSRSSFKPPPDLREVWPGAPPRAAAVLRHGLDRDPERRPPSAGRLIEDLDQALHQPAAAVAPSHLATPRIARLPTRSLLRAVAIAGLLAALGAVLALLLTGGGDGGSSPNAGPAASARGSGNESGGHQARPPAPTTSTVTTTSTTTATVAGAPAAPAAHTDASTGAELNRQGFDLIQAGSYDEAVAVLRRAVEAFPQGTSDVNYAYALFNLGHALRLAGDPEAAIPILEQRLQIPNQESTVQQELTIARAEAAGVDGGTKPKKDEKGKKPE